MRDKIVATFRRLRYISKKDIFTVHNIVFAITVLMCGYFVVGTVNATARNWSLEQKLNSRKLELAAAEIADGQLVHREADIGVALADHVEFSLNEGLGRGEVGEAVDVGIYAVNGIARGVDGAVEVRADVARRSPETEL